MSVASPSPSAGADPDASDAPSDAIPGLAGRRFLIISAPFGSYSRKLAGVLRANGAAVSRMIFNAGDRLDWGGRNAVKFRRGGDAWPHALAGLAETYTDLILFGEAGIYNQTVIEQADRLKASVWVIENGYFRPHWVTMERNGVNARSTLPRSADGYPAPAPREPPFQPAGAILPHHVWNLALYHTVQVAGRLFYPRYVRPYSRHAIVQAAGHAWRYLKLRLASPLATDTGVIAGRGPFFIACLQREGDTTLLRYSDYATNTAFLERVIEDFARAAPKDTRLVVKNHPLDPGLVNYGAVVRRLARRHDAEGRVDFIDGGNLAELCRASRGMIVNNSTAALSAVGFGTPVKVLGQAFFDFAGLTDQKPLSDFWRSPAPPDHDLYVRFREHVLHRTQINGSYHNPAMQEATAIRMALAFAGGWDRAQVQ
ncbi:capsular biosynthesis protein [Brevundimonas sp.]|uniref:capsular biosynthesis protein n=1 Tax=Brevundimonas sp. TaxID=1871086 RepID=UPI0025B9523C|nr:capsular biosynthesis protein [Brevundimonas sp.]